MKIALITVDGRRHIAAGEDHESVDAFMREIETGGASTHGRTWIGTADGGYINLDQTVRIEEAP
jgi:hypothetical protein